jgi:hypothetical protein
MPQRYGRGILAVIRHLVLDLAVSDQGDPQLATITASGAVYVSQIRPCLGWRQGRKQHILVTNPEHNVGHTLRRTNHGST